MALMRSKRLVHCRCGLTFSVNSALTDVVARSTACLAMPALIELRGWRRVRQEGLASANVLSAALLPCLDAAQGLT